MKIIPVIDLMDGQVVHARRGLRDAYQPIQTPLCRGSRPENIIKALLGLHEFDTLYVADLDALMGKSPQLGLLTHLQKMFPKLVFWVDQGLASTGGDHSAAQIVRVVGSESLTGEEGKTLENLEGDFVLSLDYLGGRLLGAENLLGALRHWPDRVIVMTLSRVGGDEGPDYPLLLECRQRWPDKQIYAAGGVGSASDLEHLRQLGVAGVLLASALHSGGIGPQTLRTLACTGL